MLRRSVFCGLLLISWDPRVHAQVLAPATATVEGDVVDADTNAPIAGARIRLGADGVEPIFGKTGADGHFAFQNLAPELYSLNAERPGFLPLGFIPHTEKQRTSTTIDLRISRPRSDPNAFRGYSPPAYGSTPQASRSLGPDGAWHAKVKIRLMAYAVITGRVTDPDGRLLESALVDLNSTPPATPTNKARSPGFMSQTQTSDKGEFRFEYLSPGAYSIRVSSRFAIPGREVRAFTYYPHAPDLASSKPVEAGPGQRVRADIQMLAQNLVRLSGRLITPSGVMPPGTSLQTNVLLAPETALNAEHWYGTGKDVYEVRDLVPGKYLLIAVASEGPDTQTDANFKPILGLAQAVEIGDRDMDHFDLTLQPIHGVAGTVTFREGCTPHPLIPMSTTLTRWDLKGIVATDGRFVLHDFGVGRFMLVVHLASDHTALFETNPNVTVRWGFRDITRSGFEAPLKSNESLDVEVGCTGSQGRR